jgi:geranylgeranyl diphosphate synthase type II
LRDFSEELSIFTDTFNPFLESCIPHEKQLPQKTVLEAMRYSLLSGGKRIRPFLLTSFCKSCGGTEREAFPFAAAIEMVHTYSLIHDDLPCMDNDDLRRGRPTNHIVYGEGIALLAGDGLLNAAIETAVQKSLEAGITENRILRAVNILFAASGWQGMLGGQMMDIESEGTSFPIEKLLLIHKLKTAALLRAAAEIGCIVGGGIEEQVKQAGEYAQKLGIAFQIVDDVLDEIGDTEALGKKTGSDSANHKTTYVTLLGVSRAKEEAARYSAEAKIALQSFKDCRYYSDLLDFLLERGK